MRYRGRCTRLEGHRKVDPDMCTCRWSAWNIGNAIARIEAWTLEFDPDFRNLIDDLSALFVETS